MPEYWLGVSQPGGFDLKVSLDRRSFDRIHRARGALLEVLEPGIVNVVQANAATVLELLGALDAHIEEQGIDRPPFDGFMFFMRTSVTNWLTSWGAYREHCLALYGKDTPRWKKVRAAQRREFDASSAYRLAEGLRVYATHVRLPPLELSVSEYLDPAAGEATVSRRCFFDPAELLATWDSWHSNTKTDLRASAAPIDLGKFVTSSMECLSRLEQFMYRIRLPERRRAARVVKRAHARIGSPDRPGIYERAPSTGVPGESRLEEALLPVQLAERLLQ